MLEALSAGTLHLDIISNKVSAMLERTFMSDTAINDYRDNIHFTMPVHPGFTVRQEAGISQVDKVIHAGFCFTVSAEEATANKEIHVFIEEQVLVAIENGEEVYSFDIVTRRDGKETTTGKYKVFRKHEKYTSKTYGSEMPYTIFFTEDGKAIHGTQMATLRSYLHSYLTESVGSQGCIGLTDDNARAFFQWAPMGATVVVMTEEQ